MKSYVLSRILEIVPVFFVISFIIFSLLALMPGDPLLIMRMENPRAFSEDPERVKELRKTYNLDKPFIVRYATWLISFCKADFGYSFLYKVPVADIIGERIANTLLLTISAWIVACAIALPIGIYSAIAKYSIGDYLISIAAFIGISIPSFWFGLMLIIVFGVYLQWLPISGIHSYGLTGFYTIALDTLKHLILPATVLSLVQVASWTRYIRTSFLEILNQDYIRTAIAKGASKSTILLKHAMRNALIPLITIISLDIPYFFGGAVIIETIFSWPGMGSLLYKAVLGSDHNLAIHCLLFITAITLISNLIADILYMFVDPRIKNGIKTKE